MIVFMIEESMQLTSLYTCVGRQTSRKKSAIAYRTLVARRKCEA